MAGPEKSTSMRSRIGNNSLMQIAWRDQRANTMFTYTLKCILAKNVLIDLRLLNVFIYGYSRKKRTKKKENYTNDQSGAILKWRKGITDHTLLHRF